MKYAKSLIIGLSAISLFVALPVYGLVHEPVLQAVNSMPNFTDEGDAYDIQPAGGYRLLTPLVTAQNRVFNEEYTGPALKVEQ